MKMTISTIIPVSREHGAACSALSQPGTADSASYAGCASVCEGRVHFRSVAFQYSGEEIDKAACLGDPIDLVVHPVGVKRSKTPGVGLMKVVQCLW